MTKNLLKILVEVIGQCVAFNFFTLARPRSYTYDSKIAILPPFQFSLGKVALFFKGKMKTTSFVYSLNHWIKIDSIFPSHLS